MRLRMLAAAALAIGLSAATHAQLRVSPVSNDQGDRALQLMFRKLRTVGTFMAATAHPDDENSGLLAKMALGQGLRATLVTATRGDGGQNEIGPEIFDALAVLRTEELMAVHRFDGAEQFFTRAVDFGYSFSIDETYEKWGKAEIIGDFVHHIRAIRPDVIVGFLWDGTSGGLHHQASTHLAAEAFRAAADPAKYPEQIRDGLRPWQAKKFYYTGGFAGAPAAGSMMFNGGEYDALLGKTYDEIGAEARSMHKCQGTSQLLALPGAGTPRPYKLQDTALPGQLQATETSMLDGLDLSLPSLAGLVAGPMRAEAARRLGGISAAVEAGAAARRGSAAVTALAGGLHEIRSLRSDLKRWAINDAERYELDFRLAQKERQFEEALVLAAAVRVEALADDPIVTPGQNVRVQIAVGNRGNQEVRVVAQNSFMLTIPPDAKSSDIYFRHEPTAARYVFDPGVPFGAPFAPTPFRAPVTLTIAGEQLNLRLPIEARYGTDVTAGEKRSELLVVPALTLTMSPGVLVVPTGSTAPREVRVTVRNNATTSSAATVRLRVPAGWTVMPASVAVTVARTDEEATVRFSVTAPAGVRPGDARIQAEAAGPGGSFTTGYQIIEYPHIRRRLLFHAAEVPVRLVDVRVAPGVNVGYVMGVGDQVPQAIAQLGVPVTLINADELAWGDLSKYSVIMTGVRAYERRADLRANNIRLLDYARAGGTVLVNYNKMEFNQAQYGPYPAQTTTNRITDENAPMRILVPTHPVFSSPNGIGPLTWAGWVQERGTYFLGQLAPEYVDLIESADPFPNNTGAKRGALVEAKVGKGRWIYIGLVLWRELPAGVPGAYQLLANLISLQGKP